MCVCTIVHVGVKLHSHMFEVKISSDNLFIFSIWLLVFRGKGPVLFKVKQKQKC